LTGTSPLIENVGRAIISSRETAIKVKKPEARLWRSALRV
jgi:hypothetical protein